MAFCVPDGMPACRMMMGDDGVRCDVRAVPLLRTLVATLVILERWVRSESTTVHAAAVGGYTTTIAQRAHRDHLDPSSQNVGVWSGGEGPCHPAVAAARTVLEGPQRP